VEVCVLETWSTICSDADWDNTDASVICRQLGFSPFGALAVSNWYTESQLLNHLTGLQCNGDENSIMDCPINSGGQSCPSWSDASVICPAVSSVFSNCTDGDVRLVDVVMPDGGEGVVAGRVEICFNSVWGTVCSSGFADLDSAAVVCRQLGFLPEGIYTALRYLQWLSLKLHLFCVHVSSPQRCSCFPAEWSTSLCTHFPGRAVLWL